VVRWQTSERCDLFSSEAEDDDDKRGTQTNAK
jgi:hypothetical protein